jgi:NAD+ dependent glucose-6-phosphate dehydrogenase
MERQPRHTEQEPKKGRILLTGSKGTIGTILRESLREEYDIVELDRQATTNEPSEFAADIADEQAVEQVFQNAGPLDCVVHLAASASHETPWEEVVDNNIKGTRTIYECARKFGVPKVVFASSTHLYGAYEGYPQTSPLDRPIAVHDPYRPDSDYGTSKGFGETLARQYYDLHGIQTIGIRIGSVAPDNQQVPPYEKLWLSHRDTAQVFKKAIETDIPFGMYFATSENERPIFDITATRQDLAYMPDDGIKEA